VSSSRAIVPSGNTSGGSGDGETGKRESVDERGARINQWSRRESSDIDEARRVSELERANGASGTRCDIDAAKRRSQTENWEVRVNQSKPKLTHIRKEFQTRKA